MGINWKPVETRFRTLRELTRILAAFLTQHLRYRRALPPDFHPRKILVIKLDHLGDVLLATPVFTNLRRTYPKAEIHALVGGWSVPVLRNCPDIDRLIPYNAPFFCRDTQSATPIERLRLFKALRQARYELVVDLRTDWLTIVFALFGNARYRLDLATLQVLSKLGRFQFSGEHEVERNLDLLRYAQIETSPCTPRFYTTSTDEKKVDALFEALGVRQDTALVAIHPGSPVALKRWRAERFAAVADWLVAHRSARVVFVGTTAESPTVATVQKQMRYPSENLAGKTTFSELAEVLRRCALFIGNDSGPMHLAAAVGTQTVGLYGPGNPARFGPVGTHCWTIRQEQNCPPCMSETCKFGGEGCMKEIEVADVIQVVGKLL